MMNIYFIGSDETLFDFFQFIFSLLFTV